MSSVPLGVLVEVLQYIVHEPPGTESNCLPLFLVSWVCRKWRNLVFSTPSLWTSVYLSPDCSYDIQQFLERSKRSLIKISIAFPDSLLTSAFIKKLGHLLPPHLERVRELSIHLCDCHTPDVFATTDIFYRFSMANLVVFEILEIHDHSKYFIKRGITRAIPKAELPWGLNLQRICVPGYWLHMAITGPRPLVTTLEVDDGMLSKKSFKAMLDNMPVLTNLIFNDQNNVVHSLVDKSDIASPIRIVIPTLKLLRFHDYNHLGADSEGICHCLVKTLIAPNLETLEICSEYSMETNPDDDFDWDIFYLDDSRLSPDVFPVHCVFDDISLQHWNSPSSQLKKIRLENVPCPRDLIELLETPLCVEYVYTLDRPYLAAGLIHLATHIPGHVRSVTFDLATFVTELNESGEEEFAPMPVLQELYTSIDLPFFTCPIFLHLSAEGALYMSNFGPAPEPITIRKKSTSSSSERYRSYDELGYLARRRYWTNRNDSKSFGRYYQHSFTSPRAGKNVHDSMEVAFSDELVDSDSDSVWGHSA